jgi:hypothetical protein
MGSPFGDAIFTSVAPGVILFRGFFLGVLAVKEFLTPSNILCHFAPIEGQQPATIGKHSRGLWRTADSNSFDEAWLRRKTCRLEAVVG